MSVQGQMKAWTLVLAVILTTTIGIPAVGKKPVNGKAQLAISYAGAGLATTCEQSNVEVSQSRDGFMRTDWADSGTHIEMALPVAWNREHPDHKTGGEFVGCHGDALDGSAEGFEGYLIIDPQKDGTVFLTSRFDYFWEFEEVPTKKKSRTVQAVLEFFEINVQLTRTDGLPFDPTPGVGAQEVKGKLEFQRFEKLYDVPTWTTLGSADVVMTISIDG